MIRGFSVCAVLRTVRVSGAMPVHEQVTDACYRLVQWFSSAED